MKWNCLESIVTMTVQIMIESIYADRLHIECVTLKKWSTFLVWSAERKWQMNNVNVRSCSKMIQFVFFSFWFHAIFCCCRMNECTVHTHSIRGTINNNNLSIHFAIGNTYSILVLIVNDTMTANTLYTTLPPMKCQIWH